MIALDLLPNEGIILQKESVGRKGQKGAARGDLILTNLNLYHVVQKGNPRKHPPQIAKFPLNQIKIINEQSQAMITGSSSPALLIIFKNGQEEFTFDSSFRAKKEMNEWISQINKQLGCQPAEMGSKRSMVIPGAETVASTLKDTVGTFKDVWGIKGKSSPSNDVITGKCIGCMAPISGKKGESIRCKYCDTVQSL